MTVIIPEGVLTLGNEAVQWVPAIASPGIAAVTVAECTAGKPTQCVIKAFNAGLAGMCVVKRAS